jgi:hypothetical protein
VSLAPGPYWPAAKANPPARAKPAAIKLVIVVRLFVMMSSFTFQVLLVIRF